MSSVRVWSCHSMKGWVVAAWHAMVTPPPVSSNTEMSSFTFCLFKPCIISTLLHTISTVLHNTQPLFAFSHDTTTPWWARDHGRKCFLTNSKQKFMFLSHWKYDNIWWSEGVIVEKYRITRRSLLQVLDFARRHTQSIISQFHLTKQRCSAIRGGGCGDCVVQPGSRRTVPLV